MMKPGATRLAAAASLLCVVALGYLAVGFYGLSVRASDLKTRWREQRYVLRGVNPYDVTAAVRGARDGPATDPPAVVQPDIGPLPNPSCYPPWAFLTANLFAPPVPWWPAVKAYFGLLNAAALFALGLWAFRLRPRPMEGALACAAVLAIAAGAVTLRLGQYSILVTALLLAMMLLDAQGRQVAAGAAFALAMLKPQMAAPFAFVLLAKRRWTALVFAGALLVAASVAVWAMTGTHPLAMLAQMFEGVLTFREMDLGLFQGFVDAGLPRDAVAKTGLVAGAVAGLALTWAFRRRSALSLMALAAVVAQCWTYHRRYDQVGLVFLVAALGVTALESRHALHWGAFLLVGLTLWLPLRERDYTPAVALLQQLIWIASLFVVMRYDFAREPVAAGRASKLP